MSFIEIQSIGINQAEDILNSLNIRIVYSIPKLGVNDTLILNESN